MDVRCADYWATSGSWTARHGRWCTHYFRGHQRSDDQRLRARRGGKRLGTVLGVDADRCWLRRGAGATSCGRGRARMRFAGERRSRSPLPPPRLSRDGCRSMTRGSRVPSARPIRSASRSVDGPATSSRIVEPSATRPTRSTTPRFEVDGSRLGTSIARWRSPQTSASAVARSRAWRRTRGRTRASSERPRTRSRAPWLMRGLWCGSAHASRFASSPWLRPEVDSAAM